MAREIESDESLCPDQQLIILHRIWTIRFNAVASYALDRERPNREFNK